MKILYVENHSVFAESVSRLFLSRHNVVIVPTISAALNELRGGGFDLLIADYDLDDGKGDELLRLLQVSTIPISVIGASSHAEGNAALLKAGASAICSKMEFDGIQAVIDKVISTSAGALES
ncbi:MAG TPA: response regulator [Candidatus Limnocylindria bacterium]|jgi:DNA-binding response OmpR family regulator|nr:response regulator [Candidatus Limnocylindria bacterium]